MADTATRLYDALVDEDDDHGCGDLPESACQDVPGSALKLVSALTLQKIGDRIVDPKTVLPWLFTALAAPTALTGLLVPVREAGSLLPQAALVPVVRRVALRKRVWIAGAAGMASAAAAMAALAATVTGATSPAGGSSSPSPHSPCPGRCRRSRPRMHSAAPSPKDSEGR